MTVAVAEPEMEEGDGAELGDEHGRERHEQDQPVLDGCDFARHTGCLEHARSMPVACARRPGRAQLSTPE